MAEPHDTGLLAQISGGLALVLGWFWTMLNGNRKKIDTVQEKIEDHEKRVLKDYPTRPEMFDALDKTIRPVHDKLDSMDSTIRIIADKLENDKDRQLREAREELERLKRG